MHTMHNICYTITLTIGPAKTQLLNPVFDESDDGLVEGNSFVIKLTSFLS